MPDKVKAVQDWPVPKNVTNVREFIGMANFYRKFIQNFSRIATPLTGLCGDKVPFVWEEEQQAAFAHQAEAAGCPCVVAA